MSGRRHVLGAALASLAAAGLCWAAEAPAQTRSLADELELEPLEDGLWLYRTTIELNGNPVESNGLVIAGSQGAIVIDTPWNDQLTSRLLDWVESSFGGIAAVVATHFHGDRLGGFAEVRRRGLESYGHAETARLALENGLPPPAASFDDELTLATGDRIVELYFPGPGHSPDNSVVWLPRQRLLFGGCLVKSAGAKSLGYLGDAVIEGWSASLEALLGRYPEARIVVPGHGAAGGQDAIRHTLDLVRSHLARERGEPTDEEAGPGGIPPADGRGGA